MDDANSTMATSATGGKNGKDAKAMLASVKAPRTPFEHVHLMHMVGSGSFGKVYYGLWMGSPVAVKVIEADAQAQNKFKIAFEAELSVSLGHPNLVQTYMFSSRAKSGTMGKDDDILETWLLQEWCDKGTLRSLFKTPRTDMHGISELFMICMEIAGAGSYLHSRGVIHGDLTSSNVLIKTSSLPKGYTTKVCDFGLARVLEGGNTEIMTAQLGTVTHMPPELFKDDLAMKLTPKADVYALGVLLWTGLTAKTPFEGLSPPQIVLKVSRGQGLKLPANINSKARRIFELCMEKEPSDRPDFDDLVVLLQDELRDLA